MHFPANSPMCFSNGTVAEIKDNKLEYFIEAAKGSSGSPVLNWDGKAIAIHQAKLDFDTDEVIRVRRCGTVLSKIIDEYFQNKANDKGYCVKLYSL